MKRTVHEVASLAGVSVRTLHYYDQIGLLPPSEVTEAGYRLYDDTALALLQQILFFRELDFPLAEISQIVNSPSFDRRRALSGHRALLLLKRERLERLIRLVDDTLKGETKMSFTEFDMTAIEQAQRQYADEVKQRWGSTDAYTESTKRTASYNKEDWRRITEESDAIYDGFAAQMGGGPASPAVAQLVADWQAHITAHFYECTNEILAGLGEMYVSDPRFTENIDKRKSGLAQFMSDAIRLYCR
ncbi:MAG: MerR family transcriptional regulator [Acetanaerobacterium sp.]